MLRLLFATVVLVPALLFGRPSPVERFPYDEVVVFVDGDRAGPETIRHRMEFLSQVGDFYNAQHRGDFYLSVFPISAQMQNAQPLFRSRRDPYNSSGEFDFRRFFVAYRGQAARTHDRDVIGSVSTIRNLMANRPASRILVIYISDMVHVTKELDLSWAGVGTVNYDYDQFRRHYPSLVRPAGAFQGRVGVIVKTVSTDFTLADPRLPDLWVTEIFRRHLRARSSTRAPAQSLTELLSDIR